MKRTCVIGGCGFIGRHLVELLTASDRKVSVIDTVPAPPEAWNGKVKYFRNRGGDGKILRRILKAADELVDLAYATVPKTSFDAPIHDISANLPFGVDLFQAACDAGVRKLVIISSGGTVYGKPVSLPITEEHPTNPISPYGITKLAIEKYALMFHHLYRLPVVVLRPGNAFGEGQRPFVGQGFIPTAMVSMLQGTPITIFGRHGTVRDYVYVKDLASGIVAALEKGKTGECYNIGTGEGNTNLQVLNTIYPLARKIGLKPEVILAPARNFDVPVNILDSAKLAGDTGWKIRTSFKQGIERTWNWFLEDTGAKR